MALSWTEPSMALLSKLSKPATEGTLMAFKMSEAAAAEKRLQEIRNLMKTADLDEAAGILNDIMKTTKVVQRILSDEDNVVIIDGPIDGQMSDDQAMRQRIDEAIRLGKRIVTMREVQDIIANDTGSLERMKRLLDVAENPESPTAAGQATALGIAQLIDEEKRSRTLQQALLETLVDQQAQAANREKRAIQLRNRHNCGIPGYEPCR